MKISTICESATASSGVIAPCAAAAAIPAIAAARSAMLAIGGSVRSTGRPQRIPTMRSRQSRSAAGSPASANSIAFLVSASASPSSNSIAARVAAFTDPIGCPAGLPDRPLRNRPRRSRAAPVSPVICRSVSGMLFSSAPPHPMRGTSRWDQHHMRLWQFCRRRRNHLALPMRDHWGQPAPGTDRGAVHAQGRARTA